MATSQYLLLIIRNATPACTTATTAQACLDLQAAQASLVSGAVYKLPRLPAVDTPSCVCVWVCVQIRRPQGISSHLHHACVRQCVTGVSVPDAAMVG